MLIITVTANQDDVIKWKHFPRYWPLWGNRRSPVDSPHKGLCISFTKGQWRGALMCFLFGLDKRLSMQSRRRWFETLSCSSWRHCNVFKRVANETTPLADRMVIFSFMMTSSNGNILRVTGLCAGNSPATSEFPAHWRPVTRSFDVYLICAWINDWVNNREAGDLRHHCAHYDVTEKW